MEQRVEKLEQTPQFDLTAVNAVQSLLVPGPVDPWSRKVTADFVDLLLWHPSVRYTVAMPAGVADAPLDFSVPSLLEDLDRRDPKWLHAEIITSPEPRQLLPDLLNPALKEFAAFAVGNSARLKSFLLVHESPWVGEQIRTRSGDNEHYVFDVARLANDATAKRLTARLGVSEKEIHYLFDLVLKYLVYAERAEGGFYLSHPLRTRQRLGFADSLKESIPREMSPVPFRIGPYIAQVAGSRGLDWFTSSLHEVRGMIHDEGIDDIEAEASVGRDVLRRIAARLQLPAGVKQWRRVERGAEVASAASGVVGSLASASIWPAIVGSGLTVMTRVWSGQVPGPLSRLRWMQWALEWPLEQQSSEERLDRD